MLHAGERGENLLGHIILDPDDPRNLKNRKMVRVAVIPCLIKENHLRADVPRYLLDPRVTGIQDRLAKDRITLKVDIDPQSFF